MSSEEQRAKKKELAKSRPCKQCVNYRKDSYIYCGSKCDFEHSGFKRIKQTKENT